MIQSDELQHSIQRALAALRQCRHPDGYWEGRLASSPLATGVALAALAGESSFPESKRQLAWQYLAQTQNKDGGWGDTEISKSNLAATLLTLSANAFKSGLTSAQQERADAYTQKLGGLRDGLRRVYGKDLTFQVPIRMAAACAGLIPWRDVDVLPFELALAPRSIMGALRLPVVSYALPALVCVGLARHAKAPSWSPPVRWLRNALTERALNLIQTMQPASGGYLEAIPITAFCLLGLKAAGRGEHPIAQNARRFLLNTQRDDGSWPVEVHLSIWNTTRAIDALAAGGLIENALNADERAATRDWILSQQCTDRSVYSDTQPGGWGWNHLSGSVPDADDTSGAILALRHLGVSSDHPSIRRGTEWLWDLQNFNGGWPTFCRGWGALPFDRSASDLTAHAIRAINCRDDDELLPALPAEKVWPEAPVKRSKRYAWAYGFLRFAQRKDGSFAPLWFGSEKAVDEVNVTYGTTHLLFAFDRLTRSITDVRDAAVQWLLSIQNPDGGFGGCAGAPSSAEETGLALRALCLHGYTLEDKECQRAARWLIDHQRPDGSWNPAPIGFYFAVLWYYEEMYPLCFALGGLGALAKTVPQAVSLRNSVTTEIAS